MIQKRHYIAKLTEILHHKFYCLLCTRTYTKTTDWNKQTPCLQQITQMGFPIGGFPSLSPRDLNLGNPIPPTRVCSQDKSMSEYWLWSTIANRYFTAWSLSSLIKLTVVSPYLEFQSYFPFNNSKISWISGIRFSLDLLVNVEGWILYLS